MFQRAKPQGHEGKKNDSRAFHKTCQGSRKYIHGEVCFVYNLYAIGWLEREDLCSCIASSLQVGSVAEGQMHRS